MKSKLIKALPLSTFIIVVILLFVGLRLWACSTCVDSGLWLSCSDAGYMYLITMFILLPAAIYISTMWWIILWLLNKRREQKKDNVNLNRKPIIEAPDDSEGAVNELK